MGASGALDLRCSLARLDLEVAAETVWALAGFGGSLASVVATSAVAGRGFRAWATARGPAHWGIMGRATLARTKLDRTVTGRTLSVILPWRAESARPKTMCWTLL